ncbi:UBX domain-containing protein 1 [Temnothorax curvispinosus]|uniref:UBX domain-containing protein 1 n=1 Tax=Temnothorax curvispinosus TaxID=300111 RepID=A0A6J1PNZ2_9HYME|nr:UBX domain-containing protein 1 [Temnothorax curvispinosus]XP_024871064.1 UBX domain-containing protein 1 [Temnothorax curvispinosus]
MSSGVIDILVDMGFSMSKAEKALEITGNKGVEPAMEWLLAHSDEAESTPEPVVGESAPALAADAPIQDNVAGASSQSVSTTETAKSMKCDVCGKLFKSNLEVEYHATKSGHDRFSESTEEKKPLSEEEKREQLKMLEEKLRQKRKEREEQEKKNAFEREKNRIRSGKEMSEARKKLEELEMQKLLEQRKREKAEEKEARQRVRAQIEADKAARRAKAAAESSAQSVINTTSTPLPAISSSASAHHRKDYTETRLQLRLTNGQTLTQSFGSKEQLSAVRLFIEMNRTDGNGPFQLMTTFPKKVFTDEDYDTPLDVLGLVPSAVVIVQKKVE